MRQRYFFGLKPPDPVVAALRAIWREQAGMVGQAHHPEDLHLTLVFLGDLELPVETLLALVKPVQAEAFALYVSRLAFWARPRVMVAYPEPAPAALLDLVAQLRQVGTAIGVVPEARPYRPHVTLARKAGALPAARLEPGILWPVRDYCLFCSDWSGPPPHYRVVGRWTLSDPVG